MNDGSQVFTIMLICCFPKSHYVFGILRMIYNWRRKTLKRIFLIICTPVKKKIKNKTVFWKTKVLNRSNKREKSFWNKRKKYPKNLKKNKHIRGKIKNYDFELIEV
jgi:hypothetical protein